jgi:DUF1009 family protein
MALEGETDPGLESLVEEMAWVKIGQLQKMVDFFKGRGLTEAAMAGGLTKENMFVNFAPDARALALAARLTQLNDDTVLRAMADEFETDGILVRPSTLYTPELLAAEGVLTRRKPTPAEETDIAFGWRIVKALGELDVGQLVVVRDRVALALEAIDGSDATIRRGGRLGREQTVVVKVCKPNQDFRFDLPSVGLGTIRTMAEVKASCLAIEAGKTLVFDLNEAVAAADEAGIAIVARKDV